MDRWIRRVSDKVSDKVADKVADKWLGGFGGHRMRQVVRDLRQNLRVVPTVSRSEPAPGLRRPAALIVAFCCPTLPETLSNPVRIMCSELCFGEAGNLLD